MSIAANYIGPGTFALAGDRTAGIAPGLRIAADCGADGIRYGTVSASAYAGGTDLTTVTFSPDTTGLTANLTGVLHGNDLPASLANHGHIGQADGGNLFASPAETRAGVSTSLAVTPAGLAASAKGLLAADTTIHVATSGNDTTGNGTADAPFASIARALDAIAGKSIAGGVVVILQVADGTYAVSSTVTINHPDADKIRILGNTSAETTVPIASIDTTAKTISVAGDYTGSLLAGDIFGLTGSATSGLNGAYGTSAIAFDGTNTVITCADETFASATVGGGSIVIKPCNRCRLVFSAGVSGFRFQTAVKFGLLNGFRIENAAGSAYALSADATSTCSIGGQNVISNWLCGLFSGNASYLEASACMIKRCTFGAYVDTFSRMSLRGGCILDGGTTAVTANKVSSAFVENIIVRDASGVDFSPEIGTLGNGNSYITA